MASAATARDSLDALCAASDISWSSDGDTLWVKLAAAETDAGPHGFRGGAGIDVSRECLGGRRTASETMQGPASQHL